MYFSEKTDTLLKPEYLYLATGLCAQCNIAVSPQDMKRNRQSICLLADTQVSTVRVDLTILWTEPEGLYTCNTKTSGGYGDLRVIVKMRHTQFMVVTDMNLKTLLNPELLVYTQSII